MEDALEVRHSAIIKAPIEDVGLAAWCFTLPEAEYLACSPAHCAAGAPTTPDGRRMWINVEIIGGALLVQHYIEEIAQPDHLRLVSTSGIFTPRGRTTVGMIWELQVTRNDDHSSAFTNTVQSFLTPEGTQFFAKCGIPVQAFQDAQRPMFAAHNR